MVYPEAKMQGEAEASRFLDAKAAVVWKVLSDLSNPETWDGLTERTQMLSKTAKGTGSRRRRQLHGGTTLEEEVTHWIEGREFKLKWSQARIPVKDVILLARVVDAGRGRSVTTLRMTYYPKLSWLGKLLDFAVLRPNLEKMLATQLENLGERCQQA